MPSHINPEFVAIGLAVTFVFKFVMLSFFLWVMIQIQKLQYAMLPLIVAAFLGAGLDMIPLVGHYVAVAALYLCIWKITRADIYPDAVFTVGLSYACMYSLTLILLAYAPVPKFHTAKGPDYNFDDGTNVQAIAAAPTTSQAPVAESAPTPPAPQDGVAADISIRGVSRSANDAMVTIQYGRKDYIISLGEGTTISTKEGPATVRFVKADTNNVTLSVRGQDVKYALK